MRTRSRDSRIYRKDVAQSSQHVGYLWNTDRVVLTDRQNIWQLNPRADDTSDSPCTGGMRPGRYAYASPNGWAGPDVHLFTVHTKSGANQDAREERENTLDRIDQAVAAFLAADTDIIIFGDFNTMGLGTPTTAMDEISELSSTVDGEHPGFEDIRINPTCTEYFDGEGGWLDHYLVAKVMDEVPASATAQVTGYCANANCSDIDGTMPMAYQTLSDHCPVILELAAEDDDN